MPEVGYRYIEFNAWYPSAVTPSDAARAEAALRRAQHPARLHPRHGLRRKQPRELSKDVAYKLRFRRRP